MSLIAKVLENLAPWRQARAWRVALSGGLDSSVLLHILSELAQREGVPPVSAIHIHHGLQPAADAWPAHCQQVCDELSVPLRVIHVDVVKAASIEQAARNARYAAFANELALGEVLLVAQHADDQAETVLFRLLRGAGVRGLSAMPKHRALGQGQLVRPLLNCSQAELRAYAQEHRLNWVDDPSNGSEQFSRNFLRKQIMPLLAQRWPQVSNTLLRASEHLSEASALLDDLAELDVAAAQQEPRYAWLSVPSLALAPLRELSEARQRNALRFWLREYTTMPDADHWQSWRTLRDATADATPLWALAGGEVHRADERLWWLSGAWLKKPQPISLPIEAGTGLPLPDNGQVRVDGALPSGQWSVAYRLGGELMTLPERGQRDLKRLLNERHVPVFIRGRLPLLMRDGKLIAVANMPELAVDKGLRWRFDWQLPTSDQGLS